MATTTTTTTTTVVDRLLAIVAGGTPGADLVTEDAELDATVPGWRFSVRGDAILQQFSQWFAQPGELEELERHVTPTGEVVTYTVTGVEGGVPCAARQVHVLTIVGDRIARDRFWCGGRWSAPRLAEMEAARR